MSGLGSGQICRRGPRSRPSGGNCGPAVQKTLRFCGPPGLNTTLVGGASFRLVCPTHGRLFLMDNGSFSYQVLKISGGRRRRLASFWLKILLRLVLCSRGSVWRPWTGVAVEDPLAGFLKGKEFSEEEVAELERWMGLVGASPLSAIAIDRATLMLNRLVDNADALIDGVIVWECLFGTGDVQELSYRVSMSMACVIFQVPAERVALQNEIKKFYNLRSKIVHGGRQLNSGEDKNCRDRVQELTLSALRALLERHPSLIGARPDKFIAFVMGQRGHGAI